MEFLYIVENKHNNGCVMLLWWQLVDEPAPVSGGRSRDGSRDAIEQYRRVVTSASQFVAVHRRLRAIDERLLLHRRRCHDDDDTRSRDYTDLVSQLDDVDSLLASLDDETPLERQALPVLQVTHSPVCLSSFDILVCE